MNSVESSTVVLHPNVICCGCREPVGNRIRFKCLTCESFELCADCESDDKVFTSHAEGSHFFAKIRDSTSLTDGAIDSYRKKVANVSRSLMHRNELSDSFAFHRSQNYDKLRNDPKALDLVKKMLRSENEYRLSKHYLTEYAKSQTDFWKTFVTEQIQQRVVSEHMSEAESYFKDTESGIDFLRGAVGNFPEHLPELMECANYVKYTQQCRRGHLRVGHTIDGKIPLVDPHTQQRVLLSDYFSEKPLVIISSSYT